MVFKYIVICFYVIILFSSSASAGERFALLIGNQEYTSEVGLLKNPINDVRLIESSLLKVGFDKKNIRIVENGSRASILAEIDDYANKVALGGSNAIAFFYYSGHGAANIRNGKNYLIPIDAKKMNRTLWYKSVALNHVTEILEKIAPNASHFIIFDACRNQLNLPQRGSNKGFSAIPEKFGMLIAFSSAPGMTASDEGKGSGPYAKALASELLKKGLDHLDLFQNVKEQVFLATNREQFPWESNGMTGRVYLSGPPELAENNERIKAELIEGLKKREERLNQELMVLNNKLAHLEKVGAVTKLEAKQQKQKAKDAIREAVIAKQKLELRLSQTKKQTELRLAEVRKELETRLSEVTHEKKKLVEELQKREQALNSKLANLNIKLSNFKKAGEASRQQAIVEKKKLEHRLTEVKQQLDQRLTELKGDKHWAGVSGINKLSIYKRYVRDYPQSKYAETAYKRIAHLQKLSDEWNSLSKTKKLPALEQFAIRSSGTEFEPIAKTRLETLKLEEEKDWDVAAVSGVRQKFADFLKQWPDGYFFEAARKRVEEINRIEKIWNRLKIKSTEQELDAFIKKYGGTEFGPQAVAKLVSIRTPSKKNKSKDREAILTGKLMAKLIDGSMIKFRIADVYILFNSKEMPAYRKKLGRNFLSEQFGKKLTAEGAFTANYWVKGKKIPIHGIAGIVTSGADNSGHLYLMQMHGEETSLANVNDRDRKYATFQIISGPQGYVCNGTQWHSILSNKSPEAVTDHCIIGNKKEN